MTVTELGELRARLRAADTRFEVVKNTLARRAAEASGRAALVPYLTGPTGLAWVAGDPAVAAKVLSDFAGEHAGRLDLKGGLLEGRELARDDVVRLAKLPSREVLLTQLAVGVASPLSGLATSMNGLLSGLARALAAVAESRGGEVPAAETTSEAAPVAEATETPADDAAPEAPAAQAAETPTDDAAPDAPAAD